MTDRLSTTSHQPGDLAALWARHHPRYLPRDRAIRLVRQLYAGELKVPLPKDLNLVGKEYLEFGLPSRWMTALHLITVLQEQVARIRREGGTNPTTEQRATTVELWTNAGIEKSLDQDTLVDLLLNESQCGMVVSLSGAHWEERADLAREIIKAVREAEPAA